MKPRILVVGAGFGGLELSTLLSKKSLAISAEVTLIDKSDYFMFGFSKLDVMFGHASRSPNASSTGTSPSQGLGCCARPSPRSSLQQAVGIVHVGGDRSSSGS